jgi:hypothetical protein
MSDIKAYLLALDGKSFADHKWDFGFIKEAFDRNGIEYIKTDSLPEVDKAFVVICGFENRRFPTKVSEELNKIKKVVLFITGDETGIFMVDKVSHPDIKIWIQSPYPDKHGKFYKMPIGCPSHMKDNLPEYTNKKNDAFFSGQITHDRRKELAEAMPNVPNALFNPTAGFTQGYEPKEYYKHLLESKIVPSPAGTATVDSFRFYEALEMLALPIGDLKNSVNEEQNFWDFTFEQSTPFIPKTNNWHEVPGIIEKGVSDYPGNMHRAVSWWIKYKRDFAYKIMEQLNG